MAACRIGFLFERNLAAEHTTPDFRDWHLMSQGLLVRQSVDVLGHAGANGPRLRCGGSGNFVREIPESLSGLGCA